MRILSPKISQKIPPYRWWYEGFFVTLEEFAGFLYIKAVWRIEEKQGYELATVLNSAFCYKLHRKTPDAEPPAVLWLIIGCKGNYFFRKSKIYSHLFLSSLLNALELTAASFVALARKVRIRLRPSKENIAVLSCHY